MPGLLNKGTPGCLAGAVAIALYSGHSGACSVDRMSDVNAAARRRNAIEVVSILVS